jgi:hypothetical protein
VKNQMESGDFSEISRGHETNYGGNHPMLRRWARGSTQLRRHQTSDDISEKDGKWENAPLSG